MLTLDGYEDYHRFVDKLAGTNVDNYIDLPMIAVMGNRSSGKSSLLSAISMIELPSSDELTTRCPIMLRMSRSDKRTATVEVIWKDIPKGKSGEEITFSPKMVGESNWDELTECIAATQKHIIKWSGKEVARDVVSVKVASPKCEDLTLIDLPGNVRSRVAGESKTLAEDIQSLIDDYLKNPCCNILAVHRANNDFHNSQIMANAKRVDPATKRTLPVLTKPDIINRGAEPAVRDLLLGLKTDAFEKGFHMVKGRGQAALNSKETIEKCLEAEVAFFQNTQPWREVQDRSLFGIPSLRRKLANLQMDLVKRTFPAIIKEMKEENAISMEAFSVLASAPSSTEERRLFFFKAKDHLVESIRSNLSCISVRDSDLDSGNICSSLFHGKCTEFMEALNLGNLADISAVKVGRCHGSISKQPKLAMPWYSCHDPRQPCVHSK
jgi:GTP-binding protein EngB required for normal cell division